MEGPGDEAPVAAGTVLEEDDAQTTPPGGKALLRLLQLLESDGYTELTEETIALAVAEDDAAQVMEAVVELGAATAGAERDEMSTRGLEEDVPGAADGDGVVGVAEDIAQAFLEAGDAMGAPTSSGPQWRSCGASTITGGQTYGSTRINVSGRVSALAVDPSRPAHVLAGSANGGVWESFDRGASWAPRTDYQATLAVGAIAFDPSNPSRVYCGTGEGNAWAHLGAGILRSTNGGTTWTRLCTAPFVGDGFYALVVDPSNGQRLFAGTRGGLWVSTDGGVNWTRRRAQRTWSISRRGTELLAACSGGLFRSTDNGTTWTAVTLPGAPTTYERLAVAIAPSNAGVAYAWGASSTTGFLWRRSGGTWTAIGLPPGAAVNQAWYDWAVAVAPDNANQVYCAAIDLHRGTLSAGTWTWVNLSSKTSGGNSIHPDQHAIAFEPGLPARIYAGNDGGVYRSDDRGINWIHCNNGLQITEFEYIAHHVGVSRWLIGGSQDNGTNRWTGPLTWEHVGDADGGDCGVHRANPQTVFHTRQEWALFRSTTGGGFGSWTNVTPARPPARPEGSSTRPSSAARPPATRSRSAGGRCTCPETSARRGHASPIRRPASRAPSTSRTPTRCSWGSRTGGFSAPGSRRALGARSPR